MRHSIRSRKLGRTVTFSRPGTEYVYADLNGKPGTLGRQICEGGRTTGSTITYGGGDPAQFAAVCRRWYRAYVRAEGRA